MNNTPWYKQFWPWFLILLPGSVVIAALITIKVATDNPVALVAEDYYKKGKAINQDLSRITQARNLGLVFEMKQEAGQLVLIQHGGPATGAALEIEFHHTTLPHHDLTQMVTQDAQGRYLLPGDKLIDGKWQVMIDAHDQSWRLQKRLHLPLSHPVWFQ
ncbi:cytochrome C oxidase Cbb3 [Ferrimonas sediminicola]|uniref:Cytochrome C oxidase Cbb3 n=1 Tax=Ferrimonas sediminicola TaxID=2569538 RepID=A0A4U1BGW5_9GAMM|nr:FixH family protein [Ferrimonas sediminicola]TKB50451.1 cytochrome C oxidase Cbb3 [Ferrimonas sediminicola]